MSYSEGWRDTYDHWKTTEPDLGPEDDGCPYCGGDGFIEGECECQSIESVCCCLHPKPPVCSHCGGNG